MKISIIGAAGGIGQATALLMSLNFNNVELSLFDIDDSVHGVGLDLSHIPSSVRVNTYSGYKNINDAISESDIIVITAGITRKPGMDRRELISANAKILYPIIEAIALNCPKAFICLVTNPINSLVPLAARILSKFSIFDAKKLFGVTTLDVLRAKSILEDKLNINVNYEDFYIMGGHSKSTILPVVNDKILKKMDSSSYAYDDFVSDVQNCGDAVVKEKRGRGSATLAMATAALKFVKSLCLAIEGQEDIIECAYVATTNKTISPFLAAPLHLTKTGWDSILIEKKIEPKVESKLLDILAILSDDISLGEKVYDLMSLSTDISNHKSLAVKC
ncbi:malate dehydrogenase [uncultured Tolumonas sp.]|uniref:malate dehydrogenase n=1 Tax=uncultured Tolumonas sp. TaxID=263765 RepID=UPI002931C780|nr:malate dehydrogenase [uncultured Tolumonas sp.]